MSWVELVTLAGCSAALSLALTYAVRYVARRVGAVAKPRADRWHKKKTALFGGVAIAGAAITVLLISGGETRVGALLALIAASGAMFALGFVDDIVHLSPPTKLIPQVLGAAVLVYVGIRLRWTGIDPLDGLLTIFWVVGITNAVNLLDNMDGLAAGVISIACAVMAVFFLQQGDTGPAAAAAILGGACLGFLVFNFNPASIFMGDSGSLFIGFFVSGLALLSSYGRSRNLLATLGVPVLILLVPIFDTTYVTLVRKLSGRPISQGGRDHTSHRLVALGLSERGAVLVLWALSVISGGLAIWSRIGGLSTAAALAVPLVGVVTFVGIYLAREKVDVDDRAAADVRPGYVAVLADLAYKRRIFEILLDVILVAFAYSAAHLLRYDGWLPVAVRQHVMSILPLLIGLKIGTFAVLGLYRGLWRYTGIEDVLRIARAVAGGSIAFALAGVFAYRLQGFSRSVLVMDGLLLLLLIGGSRIAFRVLRTKLSGRLPHARRALILGAGDSGELALREIRNNRTLDLQPIGFVDDDARLRGRRIHDLRILGGIADIPSIVRDHQIATIVVASDGVAEDFKEALRQQCSDLAIEVRHMRIDVSPR